MRAWILASWSRTRRPVEADPLWICASEQPVNQENALTSTQRLVASRTIAIPYVSAPIVCSWPPGSRISRSQPPGRELSAMTEAGGACVTRRARVLGGWLVATALTETSTRAEQPLDRATLNFAVGAVSLLVRAQSLGPVMTTLPARCKSRAGCSGG